MAIKDSEVGVKFYKSKTAKGILKRVSEAFPDNDKMKNHCLAMQIFKQESNAGMWMYHKIEYPNPPKNKPGKLGFIIGGSVRVSLSISSVLTIRNRTLEKWEKYYICDV